MDIRPMVIWGVWGGTNWEKVQSNFWGMEMVYIILRDIHLSAPLTYTINIHAFY